MVIMQADEGGWAGDTWASSLRESLAAWDISMIKNVEFNTIVPAALELFTSAYVTLMLEFKASRTLIDGNIAKMPRFKYVTPLN